MSIWRIEGGKPINGSLRVQGSKNSVLPILAASILAPCETELHNCPDLSDVTASVKILKYLGCKVDCGDGIIRIDSRCLNVCHIPHGLMREMRSSVVFLGAMIARCGQAVLSLPGGCELGPRPIDLHLSALRALGADIIEDGGEIVCRGSWLTGSHINLDLPSVGATENAMIAACAAQGTTVITNAAREPEIVDLQSYLRALGAKIGGAGTATITVEGFDPPTAQAARHRVMADRIAAATFLCAAASAGGCVELKDVTPEHFSTVIDSLAEMGCLIEATGGGVIIEARGRLKAPRPIITRPYPGFPTDAQPVLMAAALKSEGNTVFVENIFENRFRHVPELRRFGADIRTEGRVALISGVSSLRGAPVVSTDLRGGAALVVAALGAEGETRIEDAGHIVRGYEALDRQLGELGVKIIHGDT